MQELRIMAWAWGPEEIMNSIHHKSLRWKKIYQKCILQHTVNQKLASKGEQKYYTI